MPNNSEQFLIEYSPTGIKISAPNPNTPYDTTGVPPLILGIGNASADPANDPISPIDLTGGTYNGILSIGGGEIRSANFVTGSEGWQIKSNGDVEFNDGTFRGTISATIIDIGGSDASSFHVDINGNMWSGAVTFASAPFSVSNVGVVTGTFVTYKNGTTTYNIATASGTQTIAHGMGKTPTFVKFTFISPSQGGGGALNHLIAIYNGTTQSDIGFGYANGALRSTNGTAIVIYGPTGGSEAEYATGYITYDATNIYIAWTKTNSPTGTYQMMWETYA